MKTCPENEREVGLTDSFLLFYSVEYGIMENMELAEKLDGH